MTDDGPTDAGAIDYGWVMQTTFVLTVLVGAPLVAVASAFVALDGPRAWLSFAVRVGAVVWLVTAVGTFLYARSHSET